MIFKVILITLALFLLFILWLTYTPVEIDHKEEFDMYVANILKGYKHNKEIPLSDAVSLRKGVDMVVLGINHTETSGTPWQLYIVTPEKQQLVHPTKSGKFWIQHIVNWSDNSVVKANQEFEVQEIVWSDKGHIPAKCFLVSNENI